MKHLRSAGLALSFTLAAAACSSNFSPPPERAPTAQAGVPTPTPTPFTTSTSPATPVAAGTAGASTTTTSALPASGGTLALPSAAGAGGTVTFAANSSSAGATVTLTTTGDAMQVAGSPPLYDPVAESLVFDQTVTFSTFGPAFTLTPPNGYVRHGIVGATFVDESTGTSFPVTVTAQCGSTFAASLGSSTFTVTSGDRYTLRITDEDFGASPSPYPTTCPTS